MGSRWGPGGFKSGPSQCRIRGLGRSGSNQGQAKGILRFFSNFLVVLESKGFYSHFSLFSCPGKWVFNSSVNYIFDPVTPCNFFVSIFTSSNLRTTYTLTVSLEHFNQNCKNCQQVLHRIENWCSLVPTHAPGVG